jgi:hypothetical protein
VIYEYRCARGHETLVDFRGDEYPCQSPWCAEAARRRFSSNVKSSFPEHYNAAVGKHVSSEQGFKDDLKRAAEVQSIEMGYTADYEYIPREDMHPSTFGVTEEGIYEQEKRHHDHVAAGGEPIT